MNGDGPSWVQTIGSFAFKLALELEPSGSGLAASRQGKTCTVREKAYAAALTRTRIIKSTTHWRASSIVQSTPGVHELTFPSMKIPTTTNGVHLLFSTLSPHQARTLLSLASTYRLGVDIRSLP